MKVTRKTLSSMFGIPGFLAVAALTLTLVASAAAQEREYSTIPTPLGTLSSTAFGINARGDVVGTFVDKNFVQHGFLFSKGEFTVIDFRDPEGNLAQGTIARGISPSGEIVGNYWLPGDPPVASRGFLRTKKGEFINVRYQPDPPAFQPAWEIAQRILPDGTILGCRHDYDTMESMRGITIGKDGASEIDAFSSMHNGATPDLRLIVGWWVNMMTNQQQGYMIQDGVFTSFMKDGSTLTQAWDVNPDGIIVGLYRVGTATFHGFVKTGDHYDTIDYPDDTIHVPVVRTTATRVFGINPRGDIVGSYVQNRVTRAFLARVVED